MSNICSRTALYRAGGAALFGAFVLLSAPVLAQTAPGDAAAGKMVFNNTCRTCHTMTEGDNRLGPNLAGIVGRKAGSVENYSYSSAMKGAGLSWDEATLDRFIADPNAVVPNNNMKPYAGMSSEADRANLVAFLKAGAN